jgi:hypothetical protein
LQAGSVQEHHRAVLQDPVAAADITLDAAGSCVNGFATFTTSATKSLSDDGRVLLEDLGGCWRSPPPQLLQSQAVRGLQRLVLGHEDVGHHSDARSTKPPATGDRESSART